MAQWRKKIYPGDLLDADAEYTLKERADGLDRLFHREGLYDWPQGFRLKAQVGVLRQYATLSDPDVFDVGLGRIYDWCDWQRVWIDPL